jgi:hypothetical protein
MAQEASALPFDYPQPRAAIERKGRRIVHAQGSSWLLQNALYAVSCMWRQDLRPADSVIPKESVETFEFNIVLEHLRER